MTTSASLAGPGRSAHPRPDVRPLFFPRSVALVGLTERSSPEVLDNVAGRGIEVVGVHPSGRAVRGIRCVATLSELPSPPELAFMLVGHRRVEAALDEAIAAGVRHFILPGLGNEAGAEGALIARRVAGRALEMGAAVVGPNCMGVAVPERPSFWIGTVPPTFRSGHVAAVVQSGSIGEAMVALGPRIGFRCVVSSGGELVTDSADYCEFFARDAETGAVALFLESVPRPDAFARALAVLADAGKPVVCLKVGRTLSGARAVLAHSGAVVGSDVAFGALLKAYGVIQVDDYSEMVEVMEVLGRRRRPSGTRLGGLTNSGGEGALIADQAEAARMPFTPMSPGLVERLQAAFPNYVAPQNPVDAWAIDDVEKVFPGTLGLLAGSGEFDILVAQVDESQFLGAPEAENAVLTVIALADAVEGRPIFPAVTSVQTNDAPPAVVAAATARDVALLRGARNGMRALAAVARWSPRRPPDAGRPQPVDLGGLLRPGALPEFESGEILERCGVPVARRMRAATPEQAAAVAAELGYPVVVKRDGPAHKSREGGVVLGLAGAESVRAAAQRLGGPVLVAAQAKPGTEIFCGMSRDPEFGPVLVIGAGGAAAETLPGKAACLAPISVQQARQLIAESSAVAPLVPPRAVDALARVIVAIGEAAARHPEILAIDVNPLVVTESEVVAVDALVVVEGGA